MDNYRKKCVGYKCAVFSNTGGHINADSDLIRCTVYIVARVSIMDEAGECRGTLPGVI